MSNFSIQYARAVATGWTEISELEEAFPNKTSEQDIAKVIANIYQFEMQNTEALRNIKVLLHNLAVHYLV